MRGFLSFLFLWVKDLYWAADQGIHLALSTWHVDAISFLLFFIFIKLFILYWSIADYRETLESPLSSNEIKPVNLKGD